MNDELIGCLEWLGAKDSSGYGSIHVNGKQYSAHRLAWSRNNGPIPNNLHVLHKCDNRVCVNPEHLFLGTNRDNVKDRVNKGRNGHHPKRKTHCIRGHERNVINVASRGSCLVCKRERYNRLKVRLKAQP